MDASVLAKKYFGSVKNDTISKYILIKLPKLVNASSWASVELLGHVDHKYQRPAVHIKGVLAHYQGGLYYITYNMYLELAKIDKKFYKFRKSLKVSE